MSIYIFGPIPPLSSAVHFHCMTDAIIYLTTWRYKSDSHGSCFGQRFNVSILSVNHTITRK